MYSLRVVLADAGILFGFERAMEDLDIPDARIKELQRQIGQLVLDTLAESGKTVVDDLEV